MKKKTIIVFCIILTMPLILGIMYMVDMHMMKNNKKTIFSTWGYCYTPPEVLGNVIQIKDYTKENDNFTCDMALEKIFEDGKNEYYFSCIKNNYVIVKYNNGYEENIKTALKNGRVTLQDLDRFNIEYIIQEKQEQYEKSFVATVLEEKTTYMVVVPNFNESERKSADKIVVDYANEHMECSYGVGSKVVICYTGEIMETYPARINANSISILN